MEVVRMPLVVLASAARSTRLVARVVLTVTGSVVQAEVVPATRLMVKLDRMPPKRHRPERKVELEVQELHRALGVGTVVTQRCFRPTITTASRELFRVLAAVVLFS